MNIHRISVAAPVLAPINYHSADERCGFGTGVTQVCNFIRAGEDDRRLAGVGGGGR